MARDHLIGRQAPPLAEIHSPIFPFYMDFDMPLRASRLHPEFVDHIAAFLQKAIDPFFETRDTLEQPFTVIVCEKTLGSSPLTSSLQQWEVVTNDDVFDYQFERFHLETHKAEVFVKKLQTLPPDDILSLTAEETDRITPSLVGFKANNILEIEANEEIITIRPVDRLFKHGIHIHCPDLLVSVDGGKHVREYFLTLLSHHENRLVMKSLVGESFDRNQWAKIVDDQVYSDSPNGGGLRVIGCPKAKKCTVKHPKMTDRCPNNCRCNAGFAIDPSVYWPTRVFQGWHKTPNPLRWRVFTNFVPVGDVRTCPTLSSFLFDRWDGSTELLLLSEDPPDVADLAFSHVFVHENVFFKPELVILNEEETRLLTTRCEKNMVRAIQKTSVRSNADKPTDGFALFRGCPAPETTRGSRHTAPKRKRDLNDDEKDALRGGRIKANKALAENNALVDDPLILRTITNILTRFSEEYRNTTLKVRFDAKSETYLINFSGEGAKYCLCKKGFHGNANAYATIHKSGMRYEATMRCHSKKNVSYNNSFCANFFLKLPTIHMITMEEQRVLFRVNIGTGRDRHIHDIRDRVEALKRRKAERGGEGTHI